MYDDTVWKDKLIRINKNGSTWQTISYDNAGNPTEYGDAMMSWSNGRNLTSYYVPGNGDYFDMKYSADGKRIQKTQSYDDESSDYVTTYIYDGNNLVCEQEEDGSSTYYKYYLYNSQGLVGFVYADTVYTYRKNLFGDIIAIYQGATKVAEYAYDAYGKCTIVTDTGNIGRNNPFRYRGYYWDSDLELYYLMSRYYDPATGRFINADSLEYLDPETIGGLNLYSYCGNNPVMCVDPAGHSAILIGLLIGFGVGAIIGGGFEIAKQAYNGGDWNWDMSSWDWRQIGLSALGGGVAGAISSISFGSGFFGYLTAFITGGAGSVLGGMISGSVTDFQSGLIAFGIGAFANVAARGITELINKGVSSSAQKALNSPIFDDMTLEDLVASGLQNNSYSSAYNKLLTHAANLVLKANGQWVKSLMYSFASAGISSLLSGWY